MNDGKKINIWGIFFLVFIGFGLISGALVAIEPTETEIELTIQQAKNSNDPKLKQQALDLERKIQEKENAKLQKQIQKINDSIQ
jgi:hypothetical protein